MVMVGIHLKNEMIVRKTNEFYPSLIYRLLSELSYLRKSYYECLIKSGLMLDLSCGNFKKYFWAETNAWIVSGGMLGYILQSLVQFVVEEYIFGGNFCWRNFQKIKRSAF